MAKIWIIDPTDKTRVPFLRGILTRSLTEAGLSFDDAYKTSSEIRQLFGDAGEITTDELRARVADYLEEHHGADVRATYESPHLGETTLLVCEADGQLTPFSRPQHLRCLESSGLTEERAATVTSMMLQYLAERDIAEIGAGDLGMLTYRNLQEKYGHKAAHRYLVWIDHVHSGRPLIVLIGGATGTGKSTIATEVAHRLGIVRTQSTDMLREVMRMMIPQRLLPVLHASSFNAGDLLPVTESSADEIESQVAGGYLTQSELLSVPCEAVVQRALRERVSLILEGVHVHPGLLEHMEATGDAVVVMVTLAVLKREQLRARLSGRLVTAPQREASGHLDRFEKIWRLQSFLLSEADRAGIPILVNDRKEGATNLIMKTIIDELGKTFDKTPEEVFGTVA
jgi:2-phosphoglycerate kinase